MEKKNELEIRFGRRIVITINNPKKNTLIALALILAVIVVAIVVKAY